MGKPWGSGWVSEPSNTGMISTPSRQPSKTLPLDQLRYYTSKRFVKPQEEGAAGFGGQTDASSVVRWT